MTAMRSHSCGVMTNHTVSAKNATSAPTLRMFLPGSINGVDLMRAESFRLAMIDPVNVTAPMNTPMKTSAEWMPSRPSWPSWRASALPRSPSTCR